MSIRIFITEGLYPNAEVERGGARWSVGTFYTLIPHERWKVECVPLPGREIYCSHKGKVVKCPGNCKGEVISYGEMWKRISRNPRPEVKGEIQLQLFWGGPWETLLEFTSKPELPYSQRLFFFWVAEMVPKFFSSIPQRRAEYIVDRKSKGLIGGLRKIGEPPIQGQEKEEGLPLSIYVPGGYVLTRNQGKSWSYYVEDEHGWRCAKESMEWGEVLEMIMSWGEDTIAYAFEYEAEDISIGSEIEKDALKCEDGRKAYWVVWDHYYPWSRKRHS